MGMITNLLLENGVSWIENDLHQHYNANTCFNIDFPLLTKNRQFSSVSTFVFVVSSLLYKHIQPAVDSRSRSRHGV